MTKDEILKIGLSLSAERTGLLIAEQALQRASAAQAIQAEEMQRTCGDSQART